MVDLVIFAAIVWARLADPISWGIAAFSYLTIAVFSLDWKARLLLASLATAFGIGLLVHFIHSGLQSMGDTVAPKDALYYGTLLAASLVRCSLFEFCRLVWKQSQKP